MIIIDRPPMWEEINAAFDVEGKPVIFSWGENIYNPQGVKVQRELMAHEAIHAARQGASEEQIVAWWKRYIAEPEFRLDEEIPAHAAEYKAFCKRHGDQDARRKFLKVVAGRLASPLYRVLLKGADAEYAVLTGARA